MDKPKDILPPDSYLAVKYFATIDMMGDIHAYIQKLNQEHGSVLDAQTEINMTHSLTKFLESATLKFIKGQLEHGGKINDKSRDLKHEISNETIDLFWYNEADQWPRI